MYVSSCVPNYPSIEWSKVVSGEIKPPVGCYRKLEHRQSAIKYLVENCLHRKNLDRILPLKVQDFKDFHLYGLLTTYYNCSPKKALQETYPDLLSTHDVFNDVEIILTDLLVLKTLKEPPRGFWVNEKHRISTVKFLVENLLKKTPPEVSARDFISHGLGGFLSHYYNGSPHRALIEAYPHSPVFLFHRLDPKVWEDKTLRLAALKHFLPLIPPGTRKITMKTLFKLGLKQSLAAYYGGDIKSLLQEAESAGIFNNPI